MQQKGPTGGLELHRLWRTVVEPVLEATRPAVILEIGASDGRNTEHLLEYCRQNGGVCHTIDPVPGFDVSEWQARYGDVFVFHRRTSLEALPEVPVPDVALIDGDHNWYTVFHELRLIEERARAEKRDLPVVVLHDVGWPYGRRDLYYDPSTIPAGERQPFRKGGMRPGHAELVDEGGLNPSFHNAVTEGGARNGVLTAVEDFVKDNERPVGLTVVPGIHDLGILYSKEAVRANGRLRELIEEFGSPEFLARQCRLVEKRRVKEVMRSTELRRELKRARKRVEELESRVPPADVGPVPTPSET